MVLRVLLNAVGIGICNIVFSSLSADSGGGSGELLALLLQRPVDEEVEQDERHEGDQVDEHRHEGRDLQRGGCQQRGRDRGGKVKCTNEGRKHVAAL